MASIAIDKGTYPFSYRHWIVPADEVDEYRLYVVRYEYSQKTMPRRAFLKGGGEWQRFDDGEVIEPFARWGGNVINPYVGTPDWREAVADVINEQITPLIERLIYSRI